MNKIKFLGIATIFLVVISSFRLNTGTKNVTLFMNIFKFTIEQYQ